MSVPDAPTGKRNQDEDDKNEFQRQLLGHCAGRGQRQLSLTVMVMVMQAVTGMMMGDTDTEVEAFAMSMTVALTGQMQVRTARHTEHAVNADVHMQPTELQSQKGDTGQERNETGAVHQ